MLEDGACIRDLGPMAKRADLRREDEASQRAALEAHTISVTAPTLEGGSLGSWGSLKAAAPGS